MFQIFLFTIIFLIGLVVGSFLNCVIYRLNSGESFLKGRSFCPRCRKKLSWFDLIPVLSFLFLKGNCRYCHKKISLQYPLVELTTGILFILVFWHLNFRFDLTFDIWILSFYLIISCFLVIIFVYDLKHYLIPDKIIFPAIGIAFIYHSISNWLYGSMALWLYGMGAALLASAFFLAIFLISQGRWLGFGDVKLVFFLGLFLGWPNTFVSLFFSFFIGALIGTILIIFKKKTLKSEIPFAPFLVVGTFFALFLGGKFIDWYFAFLL